MSVNPHRDFERPALSLESLRPPQSTPPLAAEIRARLERGDITALNPGTASLDEQFAMETPFLPLILGPEFRTKNLEIVLPQIGKATTGDSRAAAFYLRHRIIPVASFANWAQKRIIALREESLLHIKFDDALFRELRKSGAELTQAARETIRTGDIHLALRFPDQTQEALLDRCQLTFAAAAATIAKLQSESDEYLRLHGKEIIKRELADLLGGRRGDLSLSTHGPLGDRARRFQLLHAAMCARARIIEDFTLYHGLPVEDRSKAELLTACTDNPFDIASTGLFREGPAVMAQIQQHLHHLSDSQQTTIFNECILERRPLRHLRTHLPKSEEQAISPPAHAVPTLPLPPDQAPDPGILGRVAIKSAIEVHFPACSDPTRAARSLAGLVARGASSAEEVVQRLVEGVDPEKLIEQLRQARRREIPPLPASPGAAPTHSSEPSPPAELYTLSFHPDALKWLSSLDDDRARMVIRTRLTRMEDGNLGDVAPVGGYGGTRKFYEARIDYGPGYRVYYWRESGSVLYIRGGGKKDSQARDIVNFSPRD